MSSQKIIIGSKNLIVKDPAWLSRLFASGMMLPLVEHFKVEKENLVMFLLKVHDINTNKKFEVIFEIPTEESETVYLGDGKNFTSQADEKVAIWDTITLGGQFKEGVNECLRYWLDIMVSSCRLGGDEISINDLTSRTYLKWPWKKGTNEEYFESFDSLRAVHQIRLGVGYFNQTTRTVGVTLQLSQYPGKTKLAVSEEQDLKRRKRARTETQDAIEAEVSEEQSPVTE